MSKFREVLNKTTIEEVNIIKKIAKRVLVDFSAFESDNPIPIEMDIIAVHGAIHKLNLEKLLKLPDIEFAHDIAGIIHHLDRDELVLKHHFLPYSAI